MAITLDGYTYTLSPSGYLSCEGQQLVHPSGATVLLRSDLTDEELLAWVVAYEAERF